MHYSDNNIPQARVQQYIADYQRDARNSEMPAFVVSSLLAIEDAVVGSEGRAGVYLIYRADETLIYVGLSLNSVGGRIRQHCSRLERASDFWQRRPPALYQTILVSHHWEAPSLEEYLVSRAKTG